MARNSAASSLQPDALIGGRYRVERLLGKGGMGEVFAALDTASGKRVALKRLTQSDSPRLLELFKLEWHTLHGLRHARIIEVYDYGTDAGGAFYTMELLEGSDLSASAPMPWRQVCGYLRETASILGVLHARRLLHRDLSPRNLWRLPSGHIKLIDFGALAPFGVSTETVGTPPFIAPESLRGTSHEQPLDQRADLYALGALGYWLLTSVHAFPARSLSELPACWIRAPLPPSSLVKLMRGDDPDPIPAELDALFESLLKLEPAARPSSAEVLIDRINTIAGFEPESHATTVQAYLHSKVFVGRGNERKRVADCLTKANVGESQSVLVESATGMGRTRFLEELTALGRLAGAATVATGSASAVGPYGVANSLALRLLEALPKEAKQASPPFAAVLGHLSPELRARLPSVPLASLPESSESRWRLQTALSEWLWAVCREQLVMVVVDDLESIDEESAAWLAGLAQTSHPARLLTVTSLNLDDGRKRSLTVEAVRSASIRVHLPPLAAEETQLLLRSVFGTVPYLKYVSDRLHEVSQGQPAYCLQLAAYLVDTGVARYADGVWSLPTHLSDAQLPRSPSETHLARLDQLSPAARSLAQISSVQEAPFSPARCREISDIDPQATARALVELTLTGVLIESEQVYRFSHESLRETLLGELDPVRRAAAYRKLGEHILIEARLDPLERMRAGLYLFRAGDRLRAEQFVREAVSYLNDGHYSKLGIAAPMLEQAVALYREAGCDKYALVHPLAMLGMAGYFVDHRFAQRYGDEAVELLEEMLCFGLARRSRPFIGPKLSLFAALALAGVQLARKKPGAPSVESALSLLVCVATGLNGVAVSCLNVEATLRYRHALEPLHTLGEDHVAGFIERGVFAVGMLLSDHPAECLAILTAQRLHLQRGTPIRLLPDHLRAEFVAGGLVSIGVLECWKQSPVALEIASQVESFGPLYAMCADHLRAVYYAGEGEARQSQQYRQRVESHAVQLGAAWQVVTWGPVQAGVTALSTCDAMLAKRAAEELARLALELPSLEIEARRARATYLVLRGRYASVVSLLATGETTTLSAGTGRACGLLARAYNGLGEYAKARDVCQTALSPLSAEDLTFVVANLNLQIELALAEVGLANFAVARGQLDRLLAQHSLAGPLTRGTLHEARAMAALAERDFVTAREHVEQMRRCYATTEIVTLHELCAALSKKLDFAERGPTQAGERPFALPRDDGHQVTRVRLMLAHTGTTIEQRAQKALQIALEISGADDGFLMLCDVGSEPATYAGTGVPDRELMRWAEQRLFEANDAATVVETLNAVTRDDQSVKIVGKMQYCLIPLWAAEEHEDAAAAAIVLGFYNRAPHYPARDVLLEIAEHLQDVARA